MNNARRGLKKLEAKAFADINDAIESVRWPPGSKNFTIYPQSGKKTGEGNGVKPIKEAFVTMLKARGWQPEFPFPINDDDEGRPGKIDAALVVGQLAPFVVEWETGNISSSHRAMNKMALGVMKGYFSGGVLVLPTRKLYKFLTDRISNFKELQPYFPMWASLPINGYLGVIAVEHDAESLDVPRILKGTDGRALL